MKKNHILLMAAGALVALSVNPLLASNQKQGPMVIPIYGTEGGETVIDYGTPVLDDDGNMIGVRGMELGVTQTISIPLLGIENWVNQFTGLLDIDFYDGNPYLLKFTSTGRGTIDGEVVLCASGFGFHRVTSETMTEKYITSTSVFVAGPLQGVVMTVVAHNTEPLIDPPEYQSTFTGFLYVPAHVDLEDLKNQGKRFGSLNK